MVSRQRRRVIMAGGAIGLGQLTKPAVAQTPRPRVEPDGTIHVPPFDLPLSAAMSPEARTWLTERLRQPVNGLPQIARTEEEFRKEGVRYRKLLDDMFIPRAQEVMAAFPVDMRSEMIAGVPVEIFTPRDGVAERNRNRVLINLHGGAFLAGAVYVGRVESAPIAALAGIQVVSVNYRQGYEHKFPSGSEDVVAVFAALANSYPAANIGVFGGSAGGSLTGQTIAYMIDRKLPLPGAIGMFSAGGGGEGDGLYLTAIGLGNPPPPASAAVDPQLGSRRSAFGYFSSVTTADQHIATPAKAPAALLAKFPPTLLITGTRSFDMSQVFVTHRALTRAGAQASLQVFEGMPHCFYYQHQLPEARDANATIVRFFDKHLGVKAV